MIQAEYGHQGIRDVVYVGFPGHTSDASMGGTSLCSEPESLFHRECREMNVVFRDELRAQKIRHQGKEAESGSEPAGRHDSVPSSVLE